MNRLARLCIWIALVVVPWVAIIWLVTGCTAPAEPGPHAPDAAPAELAAPDALPADALPADCASHDLATCASLGCDGISRIPQCYEPSGTAPCACISADGEGTWCTL